jgi:hypothetical protein
MTIGITVFNLLDRFFAISPVIWSSRSRNFGAPRPSPASVLKRQEANQNVELASRPFVLCGLPIKKPPAAQLHQAAIDDLDRSPDASRHIRT